jgi:hypothetical protein
MDDFKHLNSALLFLFEKRTIFHDPMELNKVFFENGAVQVNPVPILEDLVTDGYVLSESRTNIGGSTYNVYIISQKGKVFIENVPKEYQNNPYGYHKKLENIEGAKKREADQLNLEKLRYDARNSKRIFKTYWYTFAFAVAGLLVSLILLILKLSGK